MGCTALAGMHLGPLRSAAQQVRWAAVQTPRGQAPAALAATRHSTSMAARALLRSQGPCSALLGESQKPRACLRGPSTASRCLIFTSHWLHQFAGAQHARWASGGPLSGLLEAASGLVTRQARRVTHCHAADCVELQAGVLPAAATRRRSCCRLYDHSPPPCQFRSPGLRRQPTPPMCH